MKKELTKKVQMILIALGFIMFICILFPNIVQAKGNYNIIRKDFETYQETSLVTPIYGNYQLYCRECGDVTHLEKRYYRIRCFKSRSR